MKNIKIICKHCKNNNVYFDATAIWNENKQEYQIENIGQPLCSDCQKETSIEKIKI
jgi:hypothetical protein